MSTDCNDSGAGIRFGLSMSREGPSYPFAILVATGDGQYRYVVVLQFSSFNRPSATNLWSLALKVKVKKDLAHRLAWLLSLVVYAIMP